MNKFIEFIKEKSLKERFLLVMGFLFFLVYFILGIIMIFWTSIPFDMDVKYRYVFGILLIGYSFIRFNRFYNDNKN